MIEHRKFRVMLVGSAHGVGVDASGVANAEISYEGKEVQQPSSNLPLRGPCKAKWLTLRLHPLRGKKAGYDAIQTLASAGGRTVCAFGCPVSICRPLCRSRRIRQ